MPNSSMCRYQKIDKSDQTDLKNLATSQYNLVFSIGGS